MRFIHPERDSELELALEDVFIVPAYFEGGSRLDVNLCPVDFVGASHPIVSANMNAVTGRRMAESMARCGGLGILPQDMALDTVERIVRQIRAAHPRFDTALTVESDATVRDVQGILRKRAHGMVVVVDEAHRPLGVVTASDLDGRDQYTRVGRLMNRDVVTVDDSMSSEAAFVRMHATRVKAAPVVNAAGAVVGILGREDPVRSEILRPALDSVGSLQVGLAIGINRSAIARAERALELGVSCLVVDTAHGHQKRMIETLREVSRIVGKRVPIVAGNVCTAEGTRALIDAGADIVKVNVGPGAMCTTRMQTGVGRPSFSSVLHCAAEARVSGHHVWADGGVKHPRDVALYLAAGASRVMVGTALAGTYESPGDIEHDANGHPFKANYGMASARAVSERTEDEPEFVRAKKSFFREGISSSKIYLRPGFESVYAIVIDMVAGLSSSLTYVGATDLQSFHEKALIGVQTLSGYGEGTPHGRERR